MAMAAFTVCVCVDLVRSLDAGVTVAVTYALSLHVALPIFAPPAMVALVILLESATFRNTPVEVAVVERLTVIEPVVVGWLNWSRRSTASAFGVTSAVSVCAEVVNTSLLATAAFTVCCCVAL